MVMCFNGFSQLEITKNYGINVGFVSAIGTHVQRFGFVFQGYYVERFAQINAAVRVYTNFRNLGPRGEHTEFNGALGLCLGYGKTTTDINRFVSSIGNQTGYKNSFAYSYNIWYNRVHTSQVTGIAAFQFDRISVILENDLLAKPMLDRFRTGAFLVQYQDHYVQYAVNCTLWTGQMGQQVRNDSLFPHKGYLNTVGSTYGNLSHGLLSAQVKFANDYGQYLQANAGIDAEQVRNAVQNRFIHDMPFIPKKFNKQNLHIPMIDTTGNQYLYRRDQVIRKPKLVLNGYTSPNIFY
jgi:hypothetical protein